MKTFLHKDGRVIREDELTEITPQPDYAARAKELLQSLLMPKADYINGITNPLIDIFVENLIQAAKQP